MRSARTGLVEPTGTCHRIRDPAALVSLCGRRGWPRGTTTTAIATGPVCPRCAAVLAGAAAPADGDGGAVVTQGRLF